MHSATQAAAAAAAAMCTHFLFRFTSCCSKPPICVTDQPAVVTGIYLYLARGQQLQQRQFSHHQPQPQRDPCPRPPSTLDEPLVLGIHTSDWLGRLITGNSLCSAFWIRPDRAQRCSQKTTASQQWRSYANWGPPQKPGPRGPTEVNSTPYIHILLVRLVLLFTGNVENNNHALFVYLF